MDDKERQMYVLREMLADDEEVRIVTSHADLFWATVGLTTAQHCAAMGESVLAEWKDLHFVLSQILVDQHPEVENALRGEEFSDADIEAYRRLEEDERKIVITFPNMAKMFHLVGALQIATRSPFMPEYTHQRWMHFGNETINAIGTRYPKVVGILEKGWYPEFDVPTNK